MSKPVEDPAFWRGRMLEALARGKTLAQAVWDTDQGTWDRAQVATRELLSLTVKPGWRILDAGCGHGALVKLLPKDVEVKYLGVDVSPDLVQAARIGNEGFRFEVANLRDLRPLMAGEFDLVVCRAMRRMVLENVGQDAWNAMLAEMRRVGKRLLLVEYEGEFWFELTEGKR